MHCASSGSMWRMQSARLIIESNALRHTSTISMGIRRALKNQHHAALAMLRQAIQVCPPDLWTHGEHPRTYWRVAYHAAAYAHLYLFKDLASFAPWHKHELDCTYLDGEAPMREPYTQAEMLEMVDLIDSEVEMRIDQLDLDAEHCGFTWYPKVSQVELLILSLRHLHGHIGQLSEVLIAHGSDVDWLGQPPEKSP